jgi:hypothetical protein
MSAPYASKDWKNGLILTGATIFGVASQIAVLAYLSQFQKQLQGWIIVIPSVLFLVIILLTMAVLSRRKRAQVSRLKTELESMGVVLVTNLSDGEKQQVAPYLGGLAQTYNLVTGVEGITWLASNRELLFFEHEHLTGSGKYTQTHTKVIVAFPETVGRLALEPLMTARCLRKGQGWGARKRAREDLKTEDPDFDRRWEIWGSDATREKFLTPSTRQRLASAPRGELWHVGDGWMACGYDISLDAENSLNFLKYVREIVSY